MQVRDGIHMRFLVTRLIALTYQKRILHCLLIAMMYREKRITQILIPLSLSGYNF